MDTIIYNAKIVGLGSDAWVGIEGERIVDFGQGIAPKASRMVDAKGQWLLPGAIDCHVHFRDPGLTHKADMASESRAALLGGVTSIIDMPNTKPATTTLALWEEKQRRAQKACKCNYAFFIGATTDNIDELVRADYSKVPGVKLFMGSSTGNMLVDDAKAIEEIFRRVPAIVAVHAEDQTLIDQMAAKVRAAYPDGNVPIGLHSVIRSAEACYRATARAVDLAKKHHRRLHICHLTTDKELLMLQEGPISEKLITSEVSPHHLLFTAADYPRLGSRIKMNPAVKSETDRQALIRAVKSGLVDMIATDHAPHLLSEKEGDAFTAVSGAPMVQFSLPAMLGLLGVENAQRAMCHAPAEVYGICQRGFIKKGYYADLVLVGQCEPYEVADSDVASLCGWTPLAGSALSWRVCRVWLNGQEVGESADIVSHPLEFDTR